MDRHANLKGLMGIANPQHHDGYCPRCDSYFVKWNPLKGQYECQLCVYTAKYHAGQLIRSDNYS